MDFKAAEDKLDFSLFKTATDSVLSIADILANSSSATVDGHLSRNKLHGLEI